MAELPGGPHPVARDVLDVVGVDAQVALDAEGVDLAHVAPVIGGDLGSEAATRARLRQPARSDRRSTPARSAAARTSPMVGVPSGMSIAGTGRRRRATLAFGRRDELKGPRRSRGWIAVRVAEGGAQEHDGAGGVAKRGGAHGVKLSVFDGQVERGDQGGPGGGGRARSLSPLLFPRGLELPGLLPRAILRVLNQVLGVEGGDPQVGSQKVDLVLWRLRREVADVHEQCSEQSEEHGGCISKRRALPDPAKCVDEGGANRSPRSRYATASRRAG